MEITFTPNEARDFIATLTFTSDGATDKVIALTGTGVNLYTVTYNAGTGTCETASAKQTSVDGEVTLPTPTLSDALVSAGWSFAGWKKESAVTSLVTEAPTLFTGTYTPEADEMLYAVYKFTEGDGNYELVESDLGTAWAGDYLIAYSSTVFADGRVGGQDADGSIGKAGVNVNPSTNLNGKIIASSWGDTYNVTLEEITSGSNTYVLKTKDGKYNYSTANSNGLDVTENRSTAKDHPLTITYNSSSDIDIAISEGAVFHYNTDSKGYFRFYKDGGQSNVYLYKKGAPVYSYFSNPSDKVTITYDANGGENAPSAQENITISSDPTVAAAGAMEKAGHTFSKWNTKADGTGTDYAAGATIEGIKKDVTLYAVWSVNKHKVSVSSIDHITIGATPEGASAIAEGANNGAVAYGTVVTLAQTADAHYTFGDWTVTKDGDAGTVVLVSEGSFTMPDYDVVVSATAPTEDAKRDVVFYSNGVQVGEKMTTYVGEAPATAPTAVYNDCLEGSNIFYGWATEPWDNMIDASALEGKTVYTGALPNVAAGEGDVNYYAVWAKGSESATDFVKLGENENSYLVQGAKIAIVNNRDDKILGSNFSVTEATHPGSDDNKLTVSASQIWTLVEQDEYDYWKLTCSDVQLGTNALASSSTKSQNIGNYSNNYSWWVISSNTEWSNTVSGCYYMYNWYNSSGTEYYNFLEYSGSAWVSYYATGVTSGNKEYYAMKLYKPEVTYSDFRTNCCEKKAITLSGVDDEVGKHFESDKEEACEGETVTLTKTENGHYTFGGFTVKDANDATVDGTMDNITGEYTFTMPETAVTVTAAWNPKNYKATVASADDAKGSVSATGGSMVDEERQVAYGSTITLTATPVDEDHYFQNWTVTPAIPELDLTQNPLVITMPGNNIAVTANFGAVAYPALTLETNEAYTLTATLANGDPIADMGAIRSGTALKVSYVLNGQNEKTGWTLTPATTYGESENYITFNMPSEALHVALAVRPYYTLGLSAENGSISAVSINSEAQALAAEYRVHEGEDVEVTAVPSDENYKFKEWVKTGDAATYSGASTTATLKVGTENMTLKAVFEAKATYNLTLNALGRTQEVIPALEGTDVASLLDGKNAVALKGYHFEGWSETEDGEAISGDALKLNGDKTVYAVYSAEAYYQKVTSTSEITDGQYLIVYEDGSLAFDGGLETLDAVGNTISVSIANKKIAINTETTAAEFTINATAETIKSASGMYIGRTSNSNGMNVDENTAYTHTLSIDDGNFVAVSSGGAYLRYNSASNQTRFRYYKSDSYSSQKAIQLYKKVESGANESNPTTVVANNEVLVIDADATLNNLTIEAGGKVETTNELTVINNLTINSEAGKSGQVSNAGNVHANNVYMDVKFYKSAATLDATTANQWYMISAPFDVNLNGGFLQTDGTPMVFGTDFDLFEYDGTKRATTGVTGWKRVSGQMKAGTACLIGFNEGQSTTIRLKAANASLAEKESIALNEYSGDAKNQNWNGVANPNLHYININKDVQIYNNEEGENGRKYISYTASTYSFVVGTAFFVQEIGSISLEAGSHDKLRAPKRESERYEACVRIVRDGAETFADQMFVRASEDASAQYEQGHDMVTWNGTTAKTALLWTENYGTRLAIEEAPLLNNQASYALGLYVPANGTYRIEVANTQTDATLYLTQGGTIIWNLTDGAYEVDLTAGTTSEYGLLLQANAPQIPTGVEEVGASKAAQKVVIDDHVYILRGEKMYDTTGKMVK